MVCLGLDFGQRKFSRFAAATAGEREHALLAVFFFLQRPITYDEKVMGPGLLAMHRPRRERETARGADGRRADTNGSQAQCPARVTRSACCTSQCVQMQRSALDPLSHRPRPSSSRPGASRAGRDRTERKQGRRARCRGPDIQGIALRPFVESSAARNPTDRRRGDCMCGASSGRERFAAAL